MRGSRQLNPTTRPKERSSREDRIDERNAALCARFYWLTYLLPVNLAYESRIKQLSKEFYIAEATICDLLVSHSATVAMHNQQKTTIKQLETQLPHFNWKTS